MGLTVNIYTCDLNKYFSKSSEIRWTTLININPIQFWAHFQKHLK